jgi:hypothetical protein
MVSILKITGDAKVDGILTALIGLGMIGLGIAMAYFWGAPSVWFEIFGGILASILVGIHYALLFAGIIYFIVGILVWKKGSIKLDIGEYWKDIKSLIIFFGVLTALEVLVLYQLLDASTFVEVIKWMAVVILGIPLISYVVYLTKKALFE